MMFLAKPVGLLALVVFCTSWSTAQSSGNCSVHPIQLSLSNVTITGGIAENRGVAVSLGFQKVGLRVTTWFNNTRVRNALDCEKSTAFESVGCQGASGSAFDIGAAAGDFREAPAGQWNGSTDLHPPDETPTYGWVKATFDSQLTIPGFPIESYHVTEGRNRSGLSLGPESSFLRTLLLGNHIPSTAWGLFFGSRSQTRGVDGILTLGGYDEKRIDGAFTKFTIPSIDPILPCPLKADVRDIRVGFRNGSSFSLFGDFNSPTASYKACVDPLQNQFNVPAGMYSRFAALTGHPAGFQEQIYPLQNEDLIWNLSVSLHNGEKDYDTVIPHYEFVSQERGTGPDGKYTVVNESQLQVALGTTSDSEPIPVLGGVFLAMNYLFVDYEAKTFSLAPAVTGPLPAGTSEIVSSCVLPENAVNNEHSRKQSGNNTAAIAGGTVGGIVLVALIAVFGFLYYKRTHRPEPQTHHSDPESAAKERKLRQWQRSELPADVS